MERRQGVGLWLSVYGVVAIGWLAATHRLPLYVHPRYITFTIAMATIVGALVVWKLLVPIPAADRHGAVLPIRSVALLLIAGPALLVVPPAALTSTTADQREVNAAVPPASAGTLSQLRGADYSHYSVRDWATALQLGMTADSLAGQRFDEVGFVAPVPGRDDAFYLARFVVTCCTVDAAPVGVPVLDAGWRDRLGKDQWVRVTGAFRSDPAHPGAPVVVPRTVQTVAEPSNPYEY